MPSKTRRPLRSTKKPAPVANWHLCDVCNRDVEGYNEETDTSFCTLHPTANVTVVPDEVSK